MEIARIARRQHGVVTRAQLLDACLTVAEIGNRVRGGSLIACASGRLPGRASGPQRQCAVLGGGARRRERCPPRRASGRLPTSAAEGARALAGSADPHRASHPRRPHPPHQDYRPPRPGPLSLHSRNDGPAHPCRSRRGPVHRRSGLGLPRGRASTTARRRAGSRRSSSAGQQPGRRRSCGRSSPARPRSPYAPWSGASFISSRTDLPLPITNRPAGAKPRRLPLARARA